MLHQNKYQNVVLQAKKTRLERDRQFKERYAEALLNRDPYYFLLATNIQEIFKYLSQD